jgi:hypothetical protein
MDADAFLITHIRGYNHCTAQVVRVQQAGIVPGIPEVGNVPQTTWFKVSIIDARREN